MNNLKNEVPSSQHSDDKIYQGFYDKTLQLRSKPVSYWTNNDYEVKRKLYNEYSKLYINVKEKCTPIIMTIHNMIMGISEMFPADECPKVVDVKQLESQENDYDAYQESLGQVKLPHKSTFSKDDLLTQI